MRSLASIMLCSLCMSAIAQESSYRREDVEQVGPYVQPDLPITARQVQRNDQLLQPGGRVLLKQLPQGDVLLRARDRSPRVEYRVAW